MRAALSFADDGKLELQAGTRDTDICRSIPGMRHSKGTWTAPATWATALAVRAAFGEDLVVHDDVYAWGGAQLAKEQWVASVKTGLYEDGMAQFPWAEGGYGFQLTGSAIMSEMAGVLNADEMGAGKTIQAALALRRLMAANRERTVENQDADLNWPLPLLVICTNSMKEKWKEELEKWVPGLEGFVVGGSAAKRRQQIAVAAIVQYDHPVAVIINWESVRLHSRLAGYGSIHLPDADKEPKELNEFGFRTVIRDEAHKAKDPHSKQTRASWALSHAATYRWDLTGTPVANSPEDLWALMHAVAPDEWPSKSRFIDRFTVSDYGQWGLKVFGFNPATKAEMDRVLDTRFIARTKAEILPYLPPITYSTRIVDMASKQAKAYDQMAEHMMAVVDDEILSAPNPLSKMTRLVQIASATPVIEDGLVVGLAEPSCKVDALLDILEELSGRQVVVFAESRKLLELCEQVLIKKGVRTLCVTGRVAPEVRAANIAAFQAGDAQVILVSLGAGAEGITLTAADTAVFLQRSWKMVANRQAEARIHRIGQESDKVEIIDVITRGTIEFAVHGTALNKEALLNEVIRDPNWVRRAIKGES